MHVIEIVYDKRWHCRYEKVYKFKHPIIGLQTVVPLLIRGVASILHTFSILSAPSKIEFVKISINCLNLLSRWYRFIQVGCKQLSPCLSRVSHQYCTYFQFYQRHLLLNIFKTLMTCLKWLLLILSFETFWSFIVSIKFSAIYV